MVVLYSPNGDTYETTNKLEINRLRAYGYTYGPSGPPPVYDPYPQYVTADELAASTLADGAVTPAKLATNAVTTTKVAAKAITAAKLADDVGTSPALRAASRSAVHTYSGPSLPSDFPSGEYVWMKTDGAGTLLDIVSGVA